MSDPLSGIGFVERSAFVAAPLAGKTLSQLGATVVKVDDLRGGPDWHRWPLGSDGRSLYWAELNRGKKSVLVDTRSAGGRELVNELAVAVGGFLTNLDARAPLSFTDLQARRPDVIYALIEGNRGGRTAIDYTVNAALGHPFVVGPADHVGPINHQLPAWDICTGLLTAVSVTAAVHKRSLGNGGALIHTSLLDVAMSVTGSLGWLAEAQHQQAPRPRIGNGIFGAFGHDFGTKDGHRIMVAAVSQRQWSALVSATSAGSLLTLLAAHGCDLETDAGRFQATPAIAGALQPWFGSRTLSQVADELDGHGVCWDLYQALPDFVSSDPRASTMNPLVQTDPDVDDGTTVVGYPVTVDNLAAEPGHVPVRGEHTEEVLMSMLGLSTSEIGKLLLDGTVAIPSTAAAPTSRVGQ